MKSLVDWWYTLPAWGRAFIIDMLETGIGAAAAVQVAIPHTAGDVAQIVVTVGAAFLGAIVSNLRRRMQAVIAARQAE